ncbi:transmembrane protein 145-like [Uranotaenia lowii]|uniref:transmembrane protein 145-like n=1 Tax=Uranotaenia lowii TaxID=190385 RepID=UPI00247AC2EA|nr:transmembrane protein 145-like [Uranotaenia lowii]
MKNVFVFSLLLLITEIKAKYVEGHLKTSADWAFLARFCFLSNHGKYQYEIEYEKRFGELKLLLYYDDKKQWPAVYKTDKTCTEKLSVLNVLDNQIVPLVPRSHYSGCKLVTQNSKDTGGFSRRPSSSSSSSSSPSSDVPLGQSPPGEDDPLSYDHFLKTSTTDSSVSIDDVDFNMTEIDFSTMETSNGSESNGGGQSDGAMLVALNVPYNNLENTTDYRVFVEELFPESDNATRVRRSAKYDSKLIVSCSNFGRFTSSRQRWWYIAISNCGSSKGLDVFYRFKMTNGEPADFWSEHFSADEMYILPMLMVESIAYTLLLLSVFLCAIELKSRHLYHCTYRLFALSVLLQWFGVLLLSVTWSKYAVSGIGPFPSFGGFFTSASEITFLLLLLLMAKGYTITRARLKTCATVKITVFTNIYAIVYVSLYIYQLEAFDPGEVLNLYESPAGFGLAGLRCIGWGFFIYSSAATIKKFTEKAPFFYPFSLFGSIWIMSGPILTVVGVNVLDPWVRESVMHGALALVAFCGHSAFLWLTWPSRANKSFPYHVRTNHVGISTVDDEVNYPRHTYEPAPPETGMIIPLASNTATLNGIYDQYLRERDIYHSASTPISYVSFPAAGKPLNSHPHNNIQTQPYFRGGQPMPITEENQQTGYTGSAPQSLAINNDGNNNYGNDTLVDSGHPSLDISISTSPPKFEGSILQQNSTDSNENRPGSGRSVAGPLSPDEEIASEIAVDKPQPTEEPKPFNPFIVGAAAAAEEKRRLPNKIILPSLEGHGVNASGTGSASSTVPRHLFAAKREERSS